MIKVVLFDYGGVLTGGGKEGALTQLVANTVGVTQAAARKAAPLLERLMLGTITTSEFVRALQLAFPQAPRKATRAGLIKNTDIFTPSREVYKLAAQLRGLGIQTAILSNMSQLSADQLRKQGLYDGFDPVVLSYEEHLAKPDPDFYERAIVRLGVRPEEILFIDDQERFLVPAEALGMHVLLARVPEQIVADARSLIFDYDGLR